MRSRESCPGITVRRQGLQFHVGHLSMYGRLLALSELLITMVMVVGVETVAAAVVAVLAVAIAVVAAQQ